MKIILVDDEPVALFGLKTQIENSGKGWTIIGCAENGLEGLKLIEDTMPDVVITDIKMPKMGGMEMINIIKSKWKDILIILYTGHSDFSFAQKGIKLGIFDYLLKPSRYEDVLLCLYKAEKYISRRNGERLESMKLKDQVDLDITHNGEKLKHDLDSESENKDVKIKHLESVNSQAVYNALEYIHQHFHEEISLKSVSEKVYLNRWYFSEVFKKELGMTFTEYILELRLKKAKELLEHRELRLSEISDMVGFKDQAYFSHIFKKHTGMTPKEFRGAN